MSLKLKTKRFLLTLIATITIGTPLLSLTAYADPAISEYAIPSSGAYPNHITKGPDGAMWLTDAANGNIDRVDNSGSVIEHQIPISGTFPFDITSGPDGALWFTDIGTNAIGRITTSGDVVEYPAAHGLGRITAGPDGNIWFTAKGDIAKMTTDGVVTVYQTQGGFYNGYYGAHFVTDITAGPDGNIWFIEQQVNPNIWSIGKITTNGSVTEYPVPYAGSTIQYQATIVSPPSDDSYPGQEAACADDAGNGCGTTDPGVTLDNITTGPDGNLWFSDDQQAVGGVDKIGKITTSGQFTEYQMPYTDITSDDDGSVAIDNLTSSSDGNLWFSAHKPHSSSSTITSIFGKVSVSGDFTEYPYSEPSAANNDAIISGLSAGSDGTLWFTDTFGDSSTFSGASGKVGRISTDTTPPTITASQTPAANAYGWNNTDVTVNFTCSDADSGVSSCSSPITLSSEGANLSATGTAVDNAGNTNSVTLSPIKIDKTAPTATNTTPNTTIIISGRVNLSANVADNLSGVIAGEYYLGNTDPGQGHGTAMTYSNSKLTASPRYGLNSGLSLGTNTIHIRAKDAAGNWSAPVAVNFTYIGL